MQEVPSDALVSLFFMVAPGVPFLLVYVAGAILCVVRWRRDPLFARLAFFAFVLFSGRLLFDYGFGSWLMLRGPELDWTPSKLELYHAILTGCSVLLGIMAW